jgi:hypothetical protein
MGQTYRATVAEGSDSRFCLLVICSLILIVYEMTRGTKICVEGIKQD